MAAPSKPPTLKIFILGSILELSSGTVLVRMISSIGAFRSLSMAGPLNIPCVAQAMI